MARISSWSSLLLLALIISCSSGPEVKEPALNEKIEADNREGSQIVPHFEGKIKLLKNDPQVESFLNRIAKKLSEKSETLSLSSVNVYLIQDMGGRVRGFGLPGNRVYLPRSLVKILDYENELAAAIAYELAHISSRTLVSRLAKYRQEHGGLKPSTIPLATIPLFGTQGIFEFPSEDYVDVCENAVTLLYQAGIDPRGLVSLWTRYENMEGKSPFDKKTLSQLLENTRMALTRFEPLINPVVRSNSFISMKKRLENL